MVSFNESGDSSLRVVPVARLTATASTFSGKLSSVAYSKCGRYLATGGLEQIFIWDLNCNKLIYVLPVTDTDVDELLVVTDEPLKLVAVARGKVSLLTKEHHSFSDQAFPLPTQQHVHGLDVSNDGAMLAAAGQLGTYVWETTNGKQFAFLPGTSGNVQQVRFLNNSRRLLTGDSHGYVCLWDLDQQSLLEETRLHLHPINRLRVSYDDVTFLSIGAEGKLGIWNVAAFSRLFQTDSCTDAVFSPDAAYVYYCRKPETIFARRLSDWEPKFHVPSLDGQTAIACTTDGLQLATVGSAGAFEIRNADDGQLRTRFYARDGSTQAICLLPQSLLLTSDVYGIIRLWDETKSECLETTKLGLASDRFLETFLNFDISSKTGRIAGMTSYGRLMWLNVDLEHSRIASIEDGPPVPISFAVIVGISPDQRQLIGCTAENEIWLVDLQTQMAYQVSQASTGPFTAVAADFESELVVCGNSNGSLVVYSLVTRMLVTRPTAYNSEVAHLAIKATTIASGSNDGAICLIDATTGRLLQQLSLPGHSRTVTCMSFSRDGKFLAIGFIPESNVSGGVVIWDVGTLETAVLNVSTVTALQFSADNMRLCLGHHDGTITIWDLLK